MKLGFWKYVSTLDNAIVLLVVAIMWTAFGFHVKELLESEDYLSFFVIGGLFLAVTIGWIVGNIFGYRDYLNQ